MIFVRQLRLASLGSILPDIKHLRMRLFEEPVVAGGVCWSLRAVFRSAVGVLQRLWSIGHGRPIEACRDTTSRQAGHTKRKTPEGTAQRREERTALSDQYAPRLRAQQRRSVFYLQNWLVPI
nr:hypothetical protein [Oceanococcus sp. HetDA_MAG_MS8]